MTWSHCIGLEPSSVSINGLPALQLEVHTGQECTLCLQASPSRDPQAAEQGGHVSPYPTLSPTSTLFPAPGCISSQNDSQRNVHVFQEEFHHNLQGSPWPCALPKQEDATFNHDYISQVPQLSSIPFPFLIQRRVRPRTVLHAPLSSALKPQHAFSKKNSQPRRKHDTEGGTVCIPRWERDIAFINTASVSLPTPFQGLAERGAHRRPLLTRAPGVALLPGRKDS